MARFLSDHLDGHIIGPCGPGDQRRGTGSGRALCVELILIHPFREGKGRLARLLADVMAVQAGNGLLDYVEWDRQKGRYFAAIQQGFAGDYDPMKRLVTAALGG
jgi:cell filamentation protein